MKAQPSTATSLDKNWVFELKLDGMRAVAFLSDDGVRLQSTNLRNVTASYPELNTLTELVGPLSGLVLDGEIIAFGDDGLPSFNALQHRMHVSDATEAARRSTQIPAIFVAFDLLHLDGHDTVGLPLTDRRSLLEQVFEPGEHRALAEQHRDGFESLLQGVIEAQLEGLVAKRPNSVYQPGRRSPDWLKIKPRLRQEFVVGGWLSGRGNRKGQIGSLLLGVYDDGQLIYAGSAGSGLDARSLKEWTAALTPTTTNPFSAPVPPVERDRTLTYVEPTEVAEIAYSEWTAGKHLRHPVVLGRRTDKDPRDIVREQ